MQTPCEYRLSVASWKQNLKMHRCVKHLRKNTDLLFSSHTTSLADVWNQRCTAGSLSKPVAPMQKQLFSAYFIFAYEAGIFQCVEMSNFCINQSEEDSSPPYLPRNLETIFSKIFSIFFSSKSILLQLHLANCLFEKSKRWMNCIQIKLISAWKGNFPSLRWRTLIFHQKAHLEIIILLCFMEMGFTFCLFHLFRRKELYKTPGF